ncbi:hypothetical protein HYV89_03460 [Candidatus Woesearchaeota archaeon]|nr:hypothetical protein [Candidatus Woesearchaeota archaeon]
MDTRRYRSNQDLAEEIRRRADCSYLNDKDREIIYRQASELENKAFNPEKNSTDDKNGN